MRRRERQREPGQPPREERLDVGLAQAVTDSLQRGRVGTSEKAVVQGREGQPAVPELPLGPLVAIQAELEGVGGVAADLDERRPPLGVDQVDVIVVHVDRFPAEGEMHLAPLLGLGGRPAGGPLLRDPHEDDARGRGEPIAIPLDDVILALPFGEVDPGDPPGVGPGPQPLLEGVGDLPKDGGRGHHPGPGAAEKGHHPALALQPRDIAVDVQPIDAFHVQRHVLSDNLSHVGHRSLPVWRPRGTTQQRPREAPTAPLGRSVVTRRFEAQLR